MHRTPGGELRWEASVHFACQKCRRSEQGNWRIPSYHPKAEQAPFVVHAYQLSLGVSVLTLQEPWAWLVAQGFKDVENRTWHTNRRGRVFIHSGLAFAKDYGRIQNWVGTHMGIVLPDPEWLRRNHQGRIVAVAEFGPMVFDHSSPWKMDGQWAWPIKWCHPINPSVPVRGQQRLWRLATDNMPLSVLPL